VAFLGAKSGIPLSAYRQGAQEPGAAAPAWFCQRQARGGTCFPATYSVQPHETALGVLTGMVKRFEQEAASVDLPAAAKQVHLTQAQVVIMASLVQAEGGSLSDYPKIARVIYNRLARGMPQQLDSTVLYGLNKFGILASNKDLTSPFAVQHLQAQGPAAWLDRQPGCRRHPGRAAPGGRPLAIFRDGEPEDRPDPLQPSSPAQFQQFRQELAHNLAKG